MSFRIDSASPLTQVQRYTIPISILLRRPIQCADVHSCTRCFWERLCMSHGTHQAFADAVRDMASTMKDPGFRAETLCRLQIASTLRLSYQLYFRLEFLSSGP